MLSKLLEKYSDAGSERIGFVLADDTIVELDNAHDDPEFGAQFSSDDLFKYLYSGNYSVKATWHTHPNQKSNLTGQDYVAFQNHPSLVHYIVGEDGVSRFYVEDGVVKRD